MFLVSPHPQQVVTAPSPDVSLIIPTYNRIQLLEEALTSVLAQDFEGSLEIIVIDDNSQDGTAEVIRQKYPDVHLIALTQNVGSYGARNQGLSKAKGKYIAFLDSDDLWEKDYLKTQISILKNQEKSKQGKYFVVSDLILWNMVKDHREVRVQRPNLERYQSAIHHLLVGTFIYTPSSAIFPRTVLEDVGHFEADGELKRYGGDSDYYARCLLAGYQPIFSNQPLVIQRKHQQGQATDIKNLGIRQKGRFERINRFYPLAAQKFSIVPLKQIYAEIHADYARQCLMKKKPFPWLMYSLKSAYHSSPIYTASNTIRDVQELYLKRRFSL